MADALRRQGIVPGTVIDVGANAGQFAVACSRLLKPAAIYSFEPIPEVAARLRMNLERIQEAAAFALAFGDREGPAEFHVNAHSHSSSVLRLADGHRAAFPEAVEARTIGVPMTTLDKFFAGREMPQPLLLKLDVQGYEAKVLAGGAAILERVTWVVAETSLRRMYEGEALFLDLTELMKRRGFKFLRPVGSLPDPRTGEMLQVDALFEREAFS
jgi:FkbM family methyltransferase